MVSLSDWTFPVKTVAEDAESTGKIEKEDRAALKEAVKTFLASFVTIQCCDELHMDAEGTWRDPLSAKAYQILQHYRKNGGISPKSDLGITLEQTIADLVDIGYNAKAHFPDQMQRIATLPQTLTDIQAELRASPLADPGKQKAREALTGSVGSMIEQYQSSIGAYFERPAHPAPLRGRRSVPSNHNPTSLLR